VICNNRERPYAADKLSGTGHIEQVNHDPSGNSHLLADRHVLLIPESGVLLERKNNLADIVRYKIMLEIVRVLQPMVVIVEIAVKNAEDTCFSDEKLI
jgi:hypothetical protein